MRYPSMANVTAPFVVKPKTEPLLNSILAGLLNENRLPPGSIVDAGAFDGSWALWMAFRWPDRRVHAVDPLASNVNIIRRQAPSNIRALCAVLGVESTTVFMDHRAQQHASKTGYFLTGKGLAHSDNGSMVAVRMRTIDELFVSDWSGERLALLHLDVEGAEREVLRGGTATLQRDMPIITVEVHVHLHLSRTRALIRLLLSSRYEVFLVEEICGMRADCRNLLCVHRGMRRSMRGSDALDMAIASRAMLAVDQRSILSQAFPCCAHGGECCRDR